MSDNDSSIQKLKEYFEKRDDIVMAFLFGSHAKGRAHSGSDWDIAVYFKPVIERVEWEEQNREYPEEDRVWGECIDILKTDNVDLIVLNRAPASICDAAIRGIPLAVKDHHLFLEFMLRVTGEATDFREFARGYAEVFWRSQSLIEQDAYALERRLMFIKEEVDALKEYSGLTWQEYQNNRIKRSVVERGIERLMNAVIDVCKTVLASRQKPIPETYREIVQKVGLIEPFSQKDLENISRWVGLRNILAHEYLDYRWKEIRDFLENHQALIYNFLEAAKKFLEENNK